LNSISTVAASSEIMNIEILYCLMKINLQSRILLKFQLKHYITEFISAIIV